MPSGLKKVSSGIEGLDEITGGGFPAGRPTLVIGSPGSGKTLLGTAFLARGAMNGDEPGVLVSFDERSSDLEVNSRSLGYDLVDLQKRKRLIIEHVQVERQQLVEAGDYDLEGLFIRLAHAVATIDAKRVVLDSLDTLFASVPNEAILRAELRRLFGWLKEQGLSAVITSERGYGEGQLSRHGIEEYISDCVILLDTRIHEELATRRLRVVKYRGTAHGSNEYPFLIEDSGITVLPVTSVQLSYSVSDARVSTGITGLDTMLGSNDGHEQGVYRGSSVLVSGGPGSGKTSVAAQFANAACRGGEKCLYFAFEESEAQLLRNMKAIGTDLGAFVKTGLLRVSAVRPTLQGLETHLASMMHQIAVMKPSVVVVDPLSALQTSGTLLQSKGMVLRLVDYIKAFGATGVFLVIDEAADGTDLDVSSLMDTWLVLCNERGNERGEERLKRKLFVAKSRGMPHSADVRELLITASGVEVRPRKDRS